MRLVEFVSEAQRPGILSRIGSKIASKFGSASAQGAVDVNDNFTKGWKAFEQWRGQSGLNYANTASVASTPAGSDTMTGASIAAKWKDNAMRAAMKELGIPLNSKTGITKDQATDLIHTYAKIITSGSVADPTGTPTPRTRSPRANPAAPAGGAPAPPPKVRPTRNRKPPAPAGGAPATATPATATPATATPATAPAARPQGGGKQPGVVSQTPNAQRKRNQRANNRGKTPESLVPELREKYSRFLSET